MNCMAINHLNSFLIHENKDIGIFSFLYAGDVWFSFNNATYQNNSLVTLKDIGENNAALLCMTNLTACCRPPYNLSGSAGNWYFPNETRVPSTDWNWDFHRTRGQMVVLMNRREGGVEGIYWCDIPDSMNVKQTIYIGVYNASTGKI